MLASCCCEGGGATAEPSTLIAQCRASVGRPSEARGCWCCGASADGGRPCGCCPARHASPSPLLPQMQILAAPRSALSGVWAGISRRGASLAVLLLTRPNFRCSEPSCEASLALCVARLAHTSNDRLRAAGGAFSCSSLQLGRSSWPDMCVCRVKGRSDSTARALDDGAACRGRRVVDELHAAAGSAALAPRDAPSESRTNKQTAAGARTSQSGRRRRGSEGPSPRRGPTSRAGYPTARRRECRRRDERDGRRRNAHVCSTAMPNSGSKSSYVPCSRSLSTLAAAEAIRRRRGAECRCT